jgi:hypothetical protein
LRHAEKRKGGNVRGVLIGGLLGGLMMIAWFVVADGILGLKSSIDMKTLPNEREVYAYLNENITEPGRYVCNPEILPEQRFPGEAPIFGVNYTGLGHDDAWQEMVLGLLVAVLAPLTGACLLRNASTRVLSQYGSRLVFFATIGIAVVLLVVLARFGLAAYSLSDAVMLGLHDLAGWVLAGVLVAWKVTPGRVSRVT